MSEDQELDHVKREVEAGKEVDQLLLEKVKKNEKRIRHTESWTNFWIVYILVLLFLLEFGEDFFKTLSEVCSGAT